MSVFSVERGVVAVSSTRGSVVSVFSARRGVVSVVSTRGSVVSVFFAGRGEVSVVSTRGSVFSAGSGVVPGVHTFWRVGLPILTRRGVLTVESSVVYVVTAFVRVVSALLWFVPLVPPCIKRIASEAPLGQIAAVPVFSSASTSKLVPISVLLSVFGMQSSVFVVCMSSVFSFFLKSCMLSVSEIIRHERERER